MGMDQLTKALELSVAGATFDTGRLEMPREGVSISYASRAEELATPGQLAELIEGKGWEATGYRRASSALLIINDETLLELECQVRCLLQDYIDDSTDRIGHAFPTGGREESYSGYSDGVRNIHGWSSPVASFTEALVKGAAVAGAEAVANHLLSWREGTGPVRYFTAALLNGVAFTKPLLPLDGIGIEPLPLSADELPVHLPKPSGMSADDYLGRTVLHIEHKASPALFRPTTASPEKVLTVQDVAGTDFDTVCKAISLECDTHVEAGFYWGHYQGVPGLSRVTDGGSWSFGGQRYERWPLTLTGGLKDQLEVAAGVLLRDGKSVPTPSEEQLRDTLKAIKTLGSGDTTRTAISRWMKSKDDRQSLEDCFIDLRIALETMYLKDFQDERTNQEMRFRVALFGAWHLGNDFTDRQRIRKVLRDSYDRASAAVHTGSISGQSANADLLANGQGLCRKGIQKLIREGSPKDWGDLVLGARYADEDSD